MRLNKATTHAIRMLISCAHFKDRHVKVAELTAGLNLTQQNGLKIANLLAHSGFVEALRGRNGGIRLSRPAAEIRLGDVVRTIESMSDEEHSTPPEFAFVSEGMEAFLNVLNRTSVQDLVPARQAGSNRKTKPKASAKSTQRAATRSSRALNSRTPAARLTTKA